MKFNTSTKLSNQTPNSQLGANPFRGTLFPLIFLLVYILFGLELGYTRPTVTECEAYRSVGGAGGGLLPPLVGGSGWGTHFTYTFQHANFMHLLLNSFSFFIFYRILRRHHSGLHIIAVSYSIAVIASFFIYYDKPVVGASAMIYAMIGLYAGMMVSTVSPPLWGSRRGVGVFIFAISISLFISFLKPNSAAMLHLVSLLLGLGAQTFLSVLGGWTFLSDLFRRKQKKQ